ncbi:MAG TPA: hypothetical protein VFZ91_16040 [Allosphingosinicella sp.]
MLVVVQMALALLSADSPAPPVTASGWAAGPGAKVMLSEAGERVYELDCSGAELVVTQFGVTHLLDLEKNQPVGDAEGTTLPAGAAVMALATDKVEPNLVGASAVRNARTGWDMTIRLSKSDPALLSLPKSKYVSLFTTGFTRAMELDRADRKLLATFVGQCRQ